VANLIRYKGHEYLLEAVARTKKRTGTAFRVVLVGRDGNNRQTLDRQVEELGLSDDVVFAGSIPRAQRLMPLFAISVLPSLEEGFSNTVLESMISGIPVVATAVGGNLEAMVDGRTGFLVPPRDPDALSEKLVRLLEDDRLRSTMGQAGRARASAEFSTEAMVQRTEEVYLNALREKAS
jgi:glycosyltransferase involved in cell wall biosynthesis